jgi:hypothetical protein
MLRSGTGFTLGQSEERKKAREGIGANTKPAKAKILETAGIVDYLEDKIQQ